MKAWSWQCHECFGAHKDIIIRSHRPSENLICPFCGGIMRVYELGKGFRTRPAVQSVVQSVDGHLTLEYKYREAA